MVNDRNIIWALASSAWYLSARACVSCGGEGTWCSGRGGAIMYSVTEPPPWILHFTCVSQYIQIIDWIGYSPTVPPCHPPINSVSLRWFFQFSISRNAFLWISWRWYISMVQAPYVDYAWKQKRHCPHSICTFIYQCSFIWINSKYTNLPKPLLPWHGQASLSHYQSLINYQLIDHPFNRWL